MAAALALRQFRKDPRQRPDQLLLLLRERHRADQQRRPLLGRKSRVHPWQRLSFSNGRMQHDPYCQHGQSEDEAPEDALLACPLYIIRFQ